MGIKARDFVAASVGAVVALLLAGVLIGATLIGISVADHYQDAAIAPREDRP